MNTLTTQLLETSACGKAILIGEHAAVYGHTAIAFALTDVTLNITFNIKKELTPQNWHEDFDIYINHNTVPTEDKNTLYQAFSYTLNCFGYKTIESFTPQSILIDSKIPLGSGMGGSAAISLCFVKLAEQLTQKFLTQTERIKIANEIDGFFHAHRASGIDVTTIELGGLIRFKKGEEPQKIKNRNAFWVALVDTQERTPTSTMVKKVAALIESNTKYKNIIDEIGQLSETSVQELHAGNLHGLAQNLNQTHSLLQKLDVSTKKTDHLVQMLLSEYGARAAKLTGGGGGGLVLALYEEKPDFLYQKMGNYPLYLSCIFTA